MHVRVSKKIVIGLY